MKESYSQLELLQSAAAVRKQAYAKYSDFTVGAALLAADGSVFLGCNVENSSYGLTICAERAAVAAAIAAGKREFRAIALVTAQPTAPCGACRQVLAEFCDDEFPIHLAPAKDLGKVKEFTLGKLLPEAFRFNTTTR